MIDDILSSIEADLAAAASPEDALHHALDRLAAWRRYFWIGLYRVEGDMARRVAFRGPDPVCSEFQLGKGNVGTTAATGVRKLVPDVSQDPVYQQCFIQVRSEIVLPVISREVSGNKVLGVLDVESDELDFFDENDEEVLSAVCELLAPLMKSAGS